MEKTKKNYFVKWTCVRFLDAKYFERIKNFVRKLFETVRPWDIYNKSKNLPNLTDWLRNFQIWAPCQEFYISLS